MNRDMGIGAGSAGSSAMKPATKMPGPSTVMGALEVGHDTANRVKQGLRELLAKMRGGAQGEPDAKPLEAVPHNPHVSCAMGLAGGLDDIETLVNECLNQFDNTFGS